MFNTIFNLNVGRKVDQLTAVAFAASAWACADTSGPRDRGTSTDGASQLLWRDSLMSSASRPGLDDQFAYFLSSDHHVAAVNKADGTIAWKTLLDVSIPDGSGFGVTVVGNIVAVGDVDVFGVDARTGTVLWTYKPSTGRGPGFARQTTDGAALFCGSVSGNVFAIDVNSGAERWVARVASGTNALVYSPVLSNGVVYVGYSETVSGTTQRVGGAAAIDAASGTVLWSRHLPQQNGEVDNAGLTGVAVTSQFVVAPTADGYVYGLDRTSGDVRVTLPPSTFTTSSDIAVTLQTRAIAGDGDGVFIGSATGWITALSGSDLHKLWMTRIELATPFDIAVSGNLVLAAYFSGQYAVFRRSDGVRLWNIELGKLRADHVEGIIDAGAVDQNRIFVGGEREVYGFKKPSP